MSSTVVTMRDVAARAGVSHTLVSCVLRDKLNGGVSVSEEKRLRILETAREMGYRPNGSAKVFRTGRFGCVTLLLSTHEARSNLPPRMWNGIYDELAARDIHLNIAKLPDEKLTSHHVPKMLREHMSDGLLIDYTDHIPQQMLDLLRADNLPAVWINAKLDADCAWPDDFGAAKQLTRHVLSLGHRRVLYLDFVHVPGDAHEHYSSAERRAGFETAMREAELEACVEMGQPVPDGEREARCVELLSGAERPTAIISYGDTEIDLLLGATTELGLALGRDIAIASFLPPSRRVLGRALTTCAVPEHEMGRVAAQLLLQKIEAPDVPLAPRALPFDFHAGATVAAL